MANTPSAKKQIRKIKTKTKDNRYWKETIKASSRSILDNLKDADKATIDKKFNLFKSVVDKAALRKILHKNKAARMKSKMSKVIATSK